MKTQNIVIRGKAFDLKAITSLQKSTSGINENISIVANYCAAQAVFFDNYNPINGLLKGAPFTLQGGQLSALGKKVADYVKAHAGNYLQFDAKESLWKSKEFKGAGKAEKRAAARGFVNPEGAKDALVCKLADDGSAPADMAFAMTFDQFLNMVKEPKQKQEGVKVTGVTGAMKKAIDAELLVGSSEELAAALDQLKALQAKLVSQLGLQLTAEAEKAARLAAAAGLAAAK